MPAISRADDGACCRRWGLRYPKDERGALIASDRRSSSCRSSRTRATTGSGHGWAHST